MDIKPRLFAPSATPVPPTGNTSEARRAFEAMLTASAQRSRSPQTPAPVQDGTLATTVRQVARTQSEPATINQDAPSRPGRVLDIKV